MQLHVISSLVRKELASYFTNPTGYIFITLFVFLSGLTAFWTPAFFERNLANLDQLNEWYGVLLILLVPAITMGAWAQERAQGTDELLLTMPATELELVIGKYLGCVCIYALCLVFAGCHVIVLAFLGSPDPGVMLSTYLGYFLSGSALIGVGLAASALSGSATISYIAGGLSCGVLILVGLFERVLPKSALAEVAMAVSVPRHFEALSRGVVELSDIVYFVGVATAGVMLCVFVLVGRRRAGSSAGAARLPHALLRGAALLVILVCGVILVDRTSMRADASFEQLWSMSRPTRQLLRDLPPDRTLAITAYVSPKVPQSYVQQRETLIGLLSEIQSVSRGRVQTKVVTTTAGSPEAREAEKSFGIKPRRIPADTGGYGATEEVFLGLALSGAGGSAGAEASVIEFLSRGLNAEYEIARAIRSAGAAKRRRIGILDTPAGLYAQFNFQTMQPGRDWSIVGELKKQYDVIRVPTPADYPSDLDVLIAPQPSAMKGDDIVRLAEYVKTGKAVLIFDDPYPGFEPGLAIAEPNRPQNPMARGQAPEPKGSMGPLNEALGARVPGDTIVWDATNPHPLLIQTPPEIVWISRPSSRATRASATVLPAFNDSDPVVSGMQECVVLFGGRIERNEPKIVNGEPMAMPEFTTLMRSGPSSGQITYSNMILHTMFGTQINPARKPNRTSTQQTIAARLTGGPNKINAILVSDLDMVSETFFAIREQGNTDLEFDNVTFVLNAVDSLAGDTSLLEIRKRRREFRTLERVEEIRTALTQTTLDTIANAETAAKAQLGEAQARFEAKIKEIEEKKDVDENTKAILIDSVRQTEQRKLSTQTTAIEDAKRQTIDDAQLQSRQAIDKTQLTIRLAAVALPPIPALAIGAIVFLRRRAREGDIYTLADPASAGR